MSEHNNRSWFKQISITLIVLAGAAGIVWFGYRLFVNPLQNDQINPYEYDIDEYRKSSPDLVCYTEVSNIDVPMKQLFALAVGPDGKIYVSGDKSLAVFNPDGEPAVYFDLEEPARCLDVAENGIIYSGMAHHVEMYDSLGIRTDMWSGLGSRSLITSIAVTESCVYVADTGNRKVMCYDRSGKLMQIIDGFLIPSPYFDVASAPDGSLWVANTGHHSLEHYTADSVFISSWKRVSMNVQDFSGCCNPTHIAILADGSIVTSEKGIERVKIYNSSGDFICMVAQPDQFIAGTKGLDLATDSQGKIFVLDPKKGTVRVFAKKGD